MTKKNLFLIAAVVCGVVLMITPSKVFAAYINCDLVVSNCNGTDNADTMTGSKAGVHANGRDGDDRIILQSQFTNITALFVLGGDGNDRIQTIGGTSGVAAGPGNDIVIVDGGAGDAVTGGTGSDIITGTGTGIGMGIAQNGFDNHPDGKIDKLNCNNARDSTAYISRDDGDIATNCAHVITAAKS